MSYLIREAEKDTRNSYFLGKEVLLFVDFDIRGYVDDMPIAVCQLDDFQWWVIPVNTQHDKVFPAAGPFASSDDAIVHARLIATHTEEDFDDRS